MDTDALNGIRRKTNAVQKLILERLWELDRKSPARVLARELFHGLPVSAEEARRELSKLGGSIVREVTGTNDETYAILFLGALLTRDGRTLEEQLAALLQLFVQTYRDDVEATEVLDTQVARELNLATDQDRSVLLRIAELSNLFGTMRPGADGHWAIGMPRDIHDIADEGDLRAYVRRKATHSYDPGEPLRYGTPRLGSPQRHMSVAPIRHKKPHRLRKILLSLGAIIAALAGLNQLGLIPTFDWYGVLGRSAVPRTREPIPAAHDSGSAKTSGLSAHRSQPRAAPLPTGRPNHVDPARVHGGDLTFAIAKDALLVYASFRPGSSFASTWSLNGRPALQVLTYSAMDSTTETTPEYEVQGVFLGSDSSRAIFRMGKNDVLFKNLRLRPVVWLAGGTRQPLVGGPLAARDGTWHVRLGEDERGRLITNRW